MEKPESHAGLEARLTALAGRIAHLRQVMRSATGLEKIKELGDIEELERRYRTLQDRLHDLNRDGPGFRPAVKAEIEKVADDLSATVEDFVMWIDAGFRPEQGPKKP